MSKLEDLLGETVEVILLDARVEARLDPLTISSIVEAMKSEPPKPREWMFCPECSRSWDTHNKATGTTHGDCPYQAIHVKEVIP